MWTDTRVYIIRIMFSSWVLKQPMVVIVRILFFIMCFILNQPMYNIGDDILYFWLDMAVIKLLFLRII